MSECDECGRESNDSMEFRLAALEKEIDLSKRVMAAHRKLCDERAAEITRLTAALAEAEAIVQAADKWISQPDDKSLRETLDDYDRLEKLVYARREKGGAK